jgi:predicted Zn-dependent protease
MRLKMMASLMFLAVASVASGEVVRPPNTGLQLELPEGWKTRVNAGSLVAEPPDGKVYLSFAVIDEAKVKTYVAQWAEGMKGGLTDLQIDVDNQVSEVNDLQQIYSVGSATLEGKPIQWDITIVKGGTKALAVIALGEGLDGDVVQQVYASIRRLEPGMKNERGNSDVDPDSGAVYPPDEEAPAEGPVDAEPAEDAEDVEETPVEEPPPPPDRGQV